MLSLVLHGVKVVTLEIETLRITVTLVVLELLDWRNKMNYGDRIVYVDGTYDEKFNEAKDWAYKHGTTFTEDLSARDLPKRVFVIGEEPKQPEPEVPHEPTREEVEANRAFLYQQLVDPITSHISRLRDEEQTDDILAQIEALKAERQAKIDEVKKLHPYPVEEEKEDGVQ